MMRKGDNMKNLNELCNELCETLTESMHTRWKHTIGQTYFSYKVGQKYIKIISNDNDGLNTSVWGFINKSNPNFEEGDILKAAGWATPALNKARGNLFNLDIKTYVDPNSSRIYGPDYLR